MLPTFLCKWKTTSNFLINRGSSTEAVVCVYVFPKNKFGDYVLTREARLAPGATLLVYRDKAAVQVYSSRSITGPRKVCVLQVLTKMLQLTKLFCGTSHKHVVSELIFNGR